MPRWLGWGRPFGFLASLDGVMVPLSGRVHTLVIAIPIHTPAVGHVKCKLRGNIDLASAALPLGHAFASSEISRILAACVAQRVSN